MPPADLIKARLLFVDDDRSFLDFLRETFTEFSRHQWEMEFATDAAQALAALRTKPVDLAMLDLNMPGVNGLQLLRMLKREFPALQMAFLSGQGDETSRRIGLEEGAAMFLEKPASLAGMESLFATINELARWQQRLGGRSVVRRAGLLDLVRMECKSGNSRLFEVFGAEESGQIWIKEGAIIHALAPEKRGQSAFTHLVCLPNAEFHLKPFADPVERSVDREWEFLVLEAARVQEQMLGTPEPPPEEPSTAPPASPAKATAPPATKPPSAPVAAPSPLPPHLLSPPVRETVLPVPPAPMRRVAEAVPETPVVPLAKPPPAPRPPPAPEFPPVAEPPAMRPRPGDAGAGELQIEELLVSSDRREVYHEWKCAEPRKWLGLIEFIATKSRQLSQGLPLGKFDRVELQSAGGRVVILQQQNRFVFVRTNTRVPAPGSAAMTGQTVTEWLAQRAPVRGLLAYGIALPDHKVLAQAVAPDIVLSALNRAWSYVVDPFATTAQLDLPAWQLRWLFERAQLYAVRRTDGASLGLLLEKQAAKVDMTAVELFFAEFQTLRLV